MAYYVTQQPHKQRYPYGRDTTHSGDYHAHIPNHETVNSGLKDAPRYPSVYRDVIESSHEDGDGIIHIEHHHHHVPKAAHPRRPRVHFAEESSDSGVQKLMKGNRDKGGVIRSVDDAADGFIKANHKCFELRHWNTFKM